MFSQRAIERRENVGAEDFAARAHVRKAAVFGDQRAVQPEGVAFVGEQIAEDDLPAARAEGFRAAMRAVSPGAGRARRKFRSSAIRRIRVQMDSG